MSKERTLLEHAAYELHKAGMTNNEDLEAQKVARDVMALVRRFEKQQHNDKTGPFVLEAFETLATRLPLTPITDDPEEWDKFEIDRKNLATEEVEKTIVWQSQRAPSLFSEDEGKTAVDQRTGKTVTPLDHKEQARVWAEADKERAERKKAAEERRTNPQPVGHVDPSVPAAEAPVETPGTAPEVKKAKKETK